MIEYMDYTNANIAHYLTDNKLSNFISVDPGYNTACVCFWKEACHSIFIRPSPMYSNNEIDKIYYLCDNFSFALIEHKPDLVIIEGTAMYQESLKSITSASKGDLLKLNRLIGAYIHVAIENSINVKLIAPQEWKGQMSKKATMLRVKREVYLPEKLNEHIIDALGIGLSLVNNWRKTR